MKFGKNLQRSVYGPWKEHYLDYGKLKELLREDDPDDDAWTDEDEGRFVDELINVQLEKVNAFQVDTYKQLRERMSDCEGRLEPFIATGKSGNGKATGDVPSVTIDGKSKEDVLNEVLKELDRISNETGELEKFSRLNFTGALKAAKKHDRKRGANYRVRPLLQVRLSSLPFNSEDYSPLLYRLSAMYTFVRQNLNGTTERSMSGSEPKDSLNRYTAYKFFVHPENLLEVKTYILRHLPILVYTPSNLKVADGTQEDPTVTSLYFDNPKLSLYSRKVEKLDPASSLRIRWYGQLSDRPELFMEKKIVHEGDLSEDARFSIKDKYVMPFIKGEYKMEKTIKKIRDRKGEDDEEIRELEGTVEDVQRFIQEQNLQPVLRANYTRTAFQIPGESKVRVSIDTDLVMIREDALDPDRPCRDPKDWHREDIDEPRLEWPFESVKKGEISRFPYALLEIKIWDGVKRRKLEWVDELMSSHLVKEAPRFSKFVHGVAALFEDYINIFPFWMSLMDTDIRRDPNDAFQEEQQKKARQAEDETAVGSFLGSTPKTSFKPVYGSPAGKGTSFLTGNGSGSSPRTLDKRSLPAATKVSEDVGDNDGHADQGKAGQKSGLRTLFPSFSTSKYARAKAQRAQLPPGVKEPSFWIKDVGPVKVEPKVWLANQRTFIKWEHISILLAAFGLSLYNAAGPSNNVGRALGVVYTLIAVFAGAWGWWMYILRSRMIEQRSGKNFDNVVGPIVICISLVVALCLNFGFKYHSFMQDRTSSDELALENLSGRAEDTVLAH